MKAIGIIAEYNPFHNGHLYHLETIKKKYKDYAIVLVLSGNFTERGEVSIIDKYEKTKIALAAGIDLIVELPFPFATQSADYFSYGALTILEYLHVEKIIFGSESNNIEDLDLIATTQLQNKDFDNLVKIYLKLGNNYPSALAKAIFDLTNKKVATPNDLLGISYIKTIKANNYKILPEAIKRKDNYHNKNLEDKYSSATAIRLALKNKENISNQVPSFVSPFLKENLHFIDDYYPFLKYKILTEKDLTIYQTVDLRMHKLLKEKILTSLSYSELVDKLKTKNITQNKIQRMLLHILCNFTKEQALEFKEIKYIRVLGFNNIGKKYLHQIKKDVLVPIISKISKNKDKMLEFELYTSKIYALTLSNEQFINCIEKEYKNNNLKGD